jgi:hypothetical protein
VIDYDERWQRRFEASQRRQALKQRAIDYKGGKCQICGYSKCSAAMVFHHPNPWEKDFSIATKASWDAIAEELDKCDLLCANCHAEVHSGLHPSYLNEEGPYWDDGDFPEGLTVETLAESESHCPEAGDLPPTPLSG